MLESIQAPKSIDLAPSDAIMKSMGTAGCSRLLLNQAVNSGT